ncbi:DNA-directed RNA polymerase II subunit 2 [Cardamine amara subsp. amara]|uniref:DNA-directed RNA polymerase n=1 Tax=Cardamine amara subsp. amara TaxID=228776 RepID=A0ABD1BB13_CARAN
MYDGHTGRPITSMICVGPVYYQRLVQLVDDKIQSRGRGDEENLTRQPTKGRREQGVQRFGEMKRDFVI